MTANTAATTCAHCTNVGPASSVASSTYSKPQAEQLVRDAMSG